MKNFNNLFKQIIENNTAGSVLGGSAGVYAAGDNRPIEPARAAIGAKVQKNKNKTKRNQQMVSVPVQRRPKVETIFLKGK